MSTETFLQNNLYINDEDYSFLKKNRDPVIKWILFFIASIATIFVFYTLLTSTLASLHAMKKFAIFRLVQCLLR